jgi:putative DNA primase/helicase
MPNVYDPIAAFAEALAAAGLGSPDIIADGELHRFRGPEDKPSESSCWYRLHLDFPPSGAYGDWRSGLKATWTAPAAAQDDAEARRHLEDTIARDRAAREAETRQRQGMAAERAEAIWRAATPADPAHPYLRNKQVAPHGIRQTGAGLLLVPVSDGERLTSLQTVDADGRKRFLRGGRTAGGFYLLPDARRPEPLLIGEGFATVASLAEETGAAGVVAFFANNLMAVARVIRARHPDAELIIAADNDFLTPGNPGRTKGEAAALAVGAKVMIPDFSDFDRPGTDWNDWLLMERAAAARQGGRHE